MSEGKSQNSTKSDEKGASFSMDGMDFVEVNDEYINRMTSYEMDCNDGKGDPLACHNCGEFFSVIMDDKHKARKIFETNCEVNNFSASCFNIAKLYFRGGRGGVKYDKEKALGLFSKACKKGHIAACFHEGTIRHADASSKLKTEAMSSSLAKDLNLGLDLLVESCKGGISDACYYAGTHWLKPDTAWRAPEKALPLLEIACNERAHAPSCRNLQVMYLHGDGVGKDMDKAKHYFSRTMQLKKEQGLGDSLLGIKKA